MGKWVGGGKEWGARPSQRHRTAGLRRHPPLQRGGRMDRADCNQSNTTYRVHRGTEAVYARGSPPPEPGAPGEEREARMSSSFVRWNQ